MDLFFRCSKASLRFIFFIAIHHLSLRIHGSLPAPYYPEDNILINCGFAGNSSAVDGREWAGDKDPSFAHTRKQIGKSISTAALHSSLSVDPVPYLTARASYSRFLYAFRVNPGQKFVRLHFNPTLYLGFEKALDLITVQAGQYTLLSNYSASLTATSLGVKSFFKEFCLNVEANEEFIIAFSPSRNSGNVFAFINGIEIVSMPSNLYHALEDNQGIQVVGHKYTFYVESDTALETVHRLNVGGSTISAIEDSGMFRKWSKDPDYLLEKDGIVQVNHATSMIKFTRTPSFTAPIKLYQTTWSVGKSKKTKRFQNFTWNLPINLGFRYLVRLHFCQHEENDAKGEFFVFISNKKTTDANDDVIKWSGGYGIATYKDYIVTVRGDKMAAKQNLTIATREGILNGIEIFKLSNPDNNLADPNPTPLPNASTKWTIDIGKLFLALGRINSNATRFIVALTSLNVLVHVQRCFWEEKFGRKNPPSSSSPSSPEQLCRQFSLSSNMSMIPWLKKNDHCTKLSAPDRFVTHPSIIAVKKDFKSQLSETNA